MEKQSRYHYANESLFRNFYWNQYGVVKRWQLFDVSKSSKYFIQRLQRWTVLDGHTGCVNTVAWSDNGGLLLTGSDDYLLNIYDACKDYELVHSINSGHRANIFSAKFLPCTSDMKIVSCSGDGMLHFNELGTQYGQNNFNCHSGTTYEVLVTPGDPNTFLSCGEDGTVRLFDLRTKSKCQCQECSEDILIDCRHAITSISVNPLVPYHLAAGCKDSYVRVFDRRMLGTSTETRSVNRNRGWMTGLFCKFKPTKLKKDMSCRVTSLQYSNDGEDLLVSYCTDYVYSFTVKDNNGQFLEATGKKIENKTNRNGTQSNDACSDNDELPPVKRLRLRGDWSDTGPQARPETDDENSPENNLMQRMSELFSRWLEDAMYTSLRRASTSSESSHHSEDATMNDIDETSPGIVDDRAQNISDSVLAEERENDFIVSDPTEEHSTASDANIRDVLLNEEKTVSQNDDGVVNFEQEIENTLTHHDSLGHTSGELMSENDFVRKDAKKRQSSDVQKNGNQAATLSISDIKSSVHEPLAHNMEEMCRHNEEASSSQRNADLDNAVNETTPLLHKPLHSTASTETGIGENPVAVGTGEIPVAVSQYDSRHELEENNDNFDSERIIHHAKRNDTQSVPSREGHYQLNRDIAASRIQNFLRSCKNNRVEITSDADKPAYLYLPKTSAIFKGHRNSKTMIKEANYWGDHYVVSGSDCGRIFIWDKNTGELVMLLQGDQHVVNCVQPHPYDPILATSGIDHDTKIWAPLAQDTADLSDLDEIVKRNERMLEESRDTITVPASFVLRMLASFGSIRNRTSTQQRTSYDDVDAEEDN